MSIDDVDILSIEVDRYVAELMDAHQHDVIAKSLELSSTQQQMTVITELNALEREKDKLAYETEATRLRLQEEAFLPKIDLKKSKSRQKSSKLF